MRELLRLRRRNDDRKGAVAVEFALIAPILLAILVGLIEVSRLYYKKNLMSIAVRDAARLASMDREGILEDGASTNDKVELDLRNFLTAMGLPGHQADVNICHPGTTTEFDLDAPENATELFEVNVSVPIRETLDVDVPLLTGDQKIGSKIIFRNAQAYLCD
jgi:Flp pilus assembly protein TadG